MKKLLALAMTVVLVAACFTACQNVPDLAAITPALASIPTL